MRRIRSAAQLILAAAFLWPGSTTALAQHSVSNPDGRIVTSSTAAQEQQEEPEVKAKTASLDSAWDMLTTATHKSTQSHIVALAALGSMGNNARAARLIAWPARHPAGAPARPNSRPSSAAATSPMWRTR